MLDYDLSIMKPDYDGGSLVNLMRSLGDALGAPSNGYAPLRALPAARLAGATRVLLLVIDGLGQALLDQLGPRSALRELLAGTMTSVYPPTTATAVTTLMSGLAPQQHGLTGWFMHFRKLGAVTAVLPFMPRYTRATIASAGVPLPAVVDTPSFCAGVDGASTALLPAFIADSDFSQAVLAGARRQGYRDLEDFTTKLTALARGASDARYVYAYWSDFDHACHVHGPSSPQVAAHFQALDTALATLAETCARHGTALVITADHGFLDSGPAERVDLTDHPRLADCLSLPLCGEPRSTYCYVRHDQAEDFARYVETSLAEFTTLVPSARLVEDGWFGHGTPHPELHARLGDYTLQMKARYTMRDTVTGERDMDLHGMHGGVTAAEQQVPLLLAL